MSEMGEDEVLGTRILLEFVGPTGRRYFAGGLVGPLMREGDEEMVEFAATEPLGIRMTSIKVVVDD